MQLPPPLHNTILSNSLVNCFYYKKREKERKRKKGGLKSNTVVLPICLVRCLSQKSISPLKLPKPFK